MWEAEVPIWALYRWGGTFTAPITPGSKQGQATEMERFNIGGAAAAVLTSGRHCDAKDAPHTGGSIQWPMFAGWTDMRLIKLAYSSCRQLGYRNASLATKWSRVEERWEWHLHLGTR